MLWVSCLSVSRLPLFNRIRAKKFAIKKKKFQGGGTKFPWAGEIKQFILKIWGVFASGLIVLVHFVVFGSRKALN